uniref:Sema domain-containing protein n=1 Tax=Mola mola TaxID=94237 RepID=A0A3Q4B7K5_MOLML
HAEGVFNYTTMLTREDLDLLVVGAREAIYVLDLHNISKKLDAEVTQQQKEECQYFRKDPKISCKNYIRILHKTEDNRMYVPKRDFCVPFHPTYKHMCLCSPTKTKFNSIQFVPDPTFVSMTQMPESEMSAEGDDDKVYLYCSVRRLWCVIAIKNRWSPVLPVCGRFGDLGGQKSLQKKWTSFLKARIDCPVLKSQLTVLFYAVFTSQSDTSDLSAVCVYRVSDISRVFTEGDYKTPVDERSCPNQWLKYSGNVPFPWPGACINNEARKAGINQTLALPDPTLQSIKLRPLMDQAIQPIGGKPLLVRRGATFTRIIVHQVQAADGEKHRVMFIGTEEGTLLKAVNYDGETFIIEEVQLFQPPESITILKYYGAAQVPLATCGRSLSCMDCVLSRRPILWLGQSCWKIEVIQSLKKKSLFALKLVHIFLIHYNMIKQHFKDKVIEFLTLSAINLTLLQDGLLILNASDSDTGRYRCRSVEHSNAGQYAATVAEYQVSIGPAGTGNGSNGPFLAVIGLLLVYRLALLTWNFYQGHIPMHSLTHRVNSNIRVQEES